jgi:hypothetical protein
MSDDRDIRELIHRAAGELRFSRDLRDGVRNRIHSSRFSFTEWILTGTAAAAFIAILLNLLLVFGPRPAPVPSGEALYVPASELPPAAIVYNWHESGEDR